MQHQTSESKEFYADNVYFVWNAAVTLIDSLSLPDEINEKLDKLFLSCNDYLCSIGKWEVDTFANVDEE